MDINSIARRHHDWVNRMGWGNKTILEAIAMVASEIGEVAGECMGTEPTSRYGEELADIVLRTSDIAQTTGIDLQKAIAGIKVEWLDTSLRGAFAEVLVDVSHWVNAAREDVPNEKFTTSMARVIRRVMDMAERAVVDLEAQVLRKISINETRGTRGRRI